MTTPEDRDDVIAVDPLTNPPPIGVGTVVRRGWHVRSSRPGESDDADRPKEQACCDGCSVVPHPMNRRFICIMRQ